jgi:6-phosphogluconate dehydrogenase (decarboxylating)
MQLGMIGLGRMGANMVLRLLEGGPSMRSLRRGGRDGKGGVGTSGG